MQFNYPLLRASTEPSRNSISGNSKCDGRRCDRPQTPNNEAGCEVADCVDRSKRAASHAVLGLRDKFGGQGIRLQRPLCARHYNRGPWYVACRTDCSDDGSCYFLCDSPIWSLQHCRQRSTFAQEQPLTAWPAGAGETPSASWASANRQSELSGPGDRAAAAAADRPAS